MAVLRSLTRGPASAAAKAATALGIADPAPEADRLAQLQGAADSAAGNLQAAREDLELAHFELEEGAPDRILATEQALHLAEQTFQRAQRALQAYHAVRDKAATADAVKARKAAWARAEELAQNRVAAAGRLAECLRAAGEQYKELVRLGPEIYNAIPADVRWTGGPASYRLSAGNTAGVVGVDLVKAGLPDAVQVSPSMLDQYPSIADIAASNLDMVRLQRSEDK